MSGSSVVSTLVLAAMGAYGALALLLGGTSLVGRSLSERTVATATRLSFGVAAIALLAALPVLFASDARRVEITLFTWFAVEHHRFDVVLLADRLSVPFGAFGTLLCGVVGAFSTRYMHREPGFNRFFVMLSLFSCGLFLLVFAGSIELLYAGWELVGLTSALLVGFFHEREMPVRNGLRVYSVYRICDLGLLGAAIVVHRSLRTGEFSALVGSAPWPAGASTLAPSTDTIVAALLLLAAMGKSAQVPFSGWLPRAMEGPTPSSAIFYGALSVHAGAYLLMRCGPVLDGAPVIAALVVGVGLVTAMHATLVGRVQTDIKSALSYASLTQVGLVFAEVGLGLRWLPLLHVVGHGFGRSLQFLRAPSLLHDLHRVEQAVGHRLAHGPPPAEWLLSARSRLALYRFAVDRAGLDAAIDRFVVEPIARVLRTMDRAERALTDRIGGHGGGA